MRRNKSILVIEDDPDIRFAVSTFLESEGYEVRTSGHGREALESLVTDGIPHLILLDMKMPVMDGWKFAAEFNARFDRKAPLVVMTAAADAAQRARDIHADGWVGKPFDLDALLSTIKRIERS